MSDENKPTDAEEIFSEFQKKQDDTKPTEVVEETPQPQEPEPQVESPPEEPKQEPTPPEPSIESTPTEPEKPSTPDSSEDSDSASRVRNVIFVGTKPIMTYVTATLTQLSSEPTVTIKARGKRITQAVDVSQMIVKRMDSVGYQVSAVRIASDSLTSQDGKTRNVSTIEIDISKT